MRRRFKTSVSIMCICWLCSGAAALHAQVSDPLAVPPVGEEGVDPDIDVLTRGPVHEAFAEQTGPNAEAGLVSPQAPPDPVNEVPPELKPDGDDVEWIPGYWFWDDERSDYIWISGVWRRLPPGRRWVPGYWQETAGGFQWISGFWSPDTVSEVEYVETPPESLETGPSSPAPSDDTFWVPGTWTWGANEYLWQPGYWDTYRDGWTWVTARYVWTPRGCVFIPGYWDFSLTLRGNLFAPVYFRSPIYRRTSFFYRPVCWIGYEPLLLHLFVRPSYHHLYFGDYYGSIYRNRHFIPCHQFHRRHLGFSSLYVYYQHHYRRRGIDYVGRVGQWHDYYERHRDRRPPHTFHEQRHHVHSRDQARPLDQDLLARRYPREAGERIGGRQLVRVSSERQQDFRRHSQQFQELATVRKRFEVPERTPATGRAAEFLQQGGSGKRDRLKLPTSLVDSSTSPRNSGRGQLPGVDNEIARINRGGPRFSQPIVRGQDGGPDRGSAVKPPRPFSGSDSATERGTTAVERFRERASGSGTEQQAVTNNARPSRTGDGSAFRRRTPGDNTAMGSTNSNSLGKSQHGRQGPRIELPLSSQRTQLPGSGSGTNANRSARTGDTPNSAVSPGNASALPRLRNTVPPSAQSRLGDVSNGSPSSTSSRSTFEGSRSRSTTGNSRGAGSPQSGSSTPQIRRRGPDAKPTTPQRSSGSTAPSSIRSFGSSRLESRALSGQPFGSSAMNSSSAPAAAARAAMRSSSPGSAVESRGSSIRTFGSAPGHSAPAAAARAPMRSSSPRSAVESRGSSIRAFGSAPGNSARSAAPRPAPPSPSARSSGSSGPSRFSATSAGRSSSVARQSTPSAMSSARASAARSSASSANARRGGENSGGRRGR